MLVCVHAQLLSCVPLVATPWTVAHQAPLSMGFSRQEYRSGLPFLSPGDFPDPGVEPVSPALTGRFFMAAHVHPWLIHVNVWQKPQQYYKVISLQLK